MQLGCFSVSLSVKDIHVSKAFYEKLGFSFFHGDVNQGWCILKNGDTNIGLFQGMFEGNILTFNPGWDQNAQHLATFTDVRDIQQHLETNGVELINKVATDEPGPANITLTDPDGNSILFDQHR